MLLRFAEKFILGPFSKKIFFRFATEEEYAKLFAKFRFNE